MGNALGMPEAKTVSKPAYKVRHQVLATDALLDVFSYVDRHTLDDANVVSHVYNTTAQHASPLRIVQKAHLSRNKLHQTFYVTVNYKRAYVDTKGGTKNERMVLRMATGNVEEAMAIFCRCLRFCNVSRSIRLFRLQIQPLFIDQLKAVAKHLFCEDYTLDFTDVTLADGVDALDLILAFPSFRELSYSAFHLLEQSYGVGDDLLKAVASRGAFYLFTELFIHAPRCSEAAVLDYMFGDYKDDGEVRKLELNWPTVSKKLLISLVQACRERRSELKIDLKITVYEDLDIGELMANGEKMHANDDGVWYEWRFRFDDLPELKIEYKLPNQEPSFSHDLENAELRCWGTIRGAARAL
ncbi:hypothetical protein AAVH_15867 [Aphelenchoides avenae]|nr:hypothetical protein AAVH_15867 [Aphelenchus avenae]